MSVFDSLIGNLSSVRYGICVYDTQKRIIFQNKTHRTWFGNILGYHCHEVYDSAHHDCGNCTLDKALNNRKPLVVDRRIHEGSFSFEASISPLISGDGKHVGSLEVVVDKTNERRSEILSSRAGSGLSYGDYSMAWALRVCLSYLFFSLFWIALSDLVIAQLPIIFGAALSIAKGSIFVMVTTFFIYMVMRKLIDVSCIKEMNLKASERKYHAIVELSPDSIILHRKGHIYYANAAAVELFGAKSYEDLIGRSVHDIVMLEDFELVEQRLKRLYAEEGAVIPLHEQRMRKLDGTQFEAEITTTSFDDDAEVSAQTMIRDVTSRIRLQKELSESARRFKELIQNMELVALILDRDSNIEYCNDYFLRVVNMEREEVVGKSFHNVFVPEAVRRQLQDMLYRSLRVGYVETHIKHAILTRAGSERMIYWNNTVMKDKDGAISGCTCIGEDITDIVRLEQELKIRNTELSEAYDSTLQGWSRALDLRDHETEGHSQRVTELSVDLATMFHFDYEELMSIRRGAMLHDIGKVGVPDAVLLKPGRLDEEERKIIEQHPVFAYNILSPIAFLESAIDVPYCHHEKWDGTGYPRGLKGEDIPLMARLFSIIDVYDALSSDRPYRKAWDRQKIIDYLLDESGKAFDPLVVKKFLEMMEIDL